MSGTVTGLDLDRLEELAGNATRGPWFIDELDRIYVGNRADGRDCGLWEIVYATGDELGDLTPRAQERERADAEFIAAMRNAAPSLLAAARTVAKIETLVTAWEADEQEYMGRFGQHIPCSLATLSEAVRAALGTEQEGQR